MKRIAVIVTLIAVVLGSVLPVMADAIAYDMDPADFYVYVATPDGGLNIRGGPGTEYDQLMEGRIPDDVKLHIRYTSGNWGYTTYNGIDGWVALKQTTKTPPKTEPKPAPAQTVTPAPEPTTPQVAEETAPVTTEEIVTPEVDDVAEQTSPKSMYTDLLLVGILVLLVVVVALLLILLLNRKKN